MSDFILYEADNLIRAATPLQQFLQEMYSFVNLMLVNVIKNGVINTIVSEPLFLFPVGFIALSATVGIVGRLLSRD